MPDKRRQIKELYWTKLFYTQKTKQKVILLGYHTNWIYFLGHCKLNAMTKLLSLSDTTSYKKQILEESSRISKQRKKIIKQNLRY
jgi:hypothetical protein